MNFEKLLSERKIEKIEKSFFNLDSCEKDLEFAKNGMITENYNRVMSVAYEAVLRAGNKFMNSLGYRAIGKEHHKNVFEFLDKIGFDRDLVYYFDKIRKKRNDFIYRDVENITKNEVIILIDSAVKFIINLKDYFEEVKE